MVALIIRWWLVVAFGLLLGQVGIMGDDTAAKPANAKAGKGHESASPPDFNALEAVSNTNMLNAIRGFCSANHIPITEVGTGPMRFMLTAGIEIPNTEGLMALSIQTLNGLEKWSGQQEIFLRKHPSDTDVFHIVVMHDGDFNNFSVYLAQHSGQHGGDPNLYQKCGGSMSPRCAFVKESAFRPCMENYCVYSAVCLAMDAYYLSNNNRKAPAWIREGASAEMQRLFCKGQVRCTSIAYEVGSGVAVMNWPADIANMIRQNDQMLLPATNIMRKDVNAISGAHYRQMWSLFTFFQQSFDNKKGLENKFYRLLAATQQGTDSENAVKNIFGVKDPALTDAWHEWASSFK